MRLTCIAMVSHSIAMDRTEYYQKFELRINRMIIFWSPRNGGLRYIRIKLRFELSEYELTGIVIQAEFACNKGH